MCACVRVCVCACVCVHVHVRVRVRVCKWLLLTDIHSHINSKEEGGQRKRKNRTGDYLQRTESGGDLKKIDLSHGIEKHRMLEQDNQVV